MPNPDFYSQCRHELASRIPLLGPKQARSAVASLAQRAAEPAALTLLMEALEHRDEKTRSLAVGVLRSFKKGAAMDALCAMAAGSPQSPAARLAQECGSGRRIRVTPQSS